MTRNVSHNSSQFRRQSLSHKFSVKKNPVFLVAFLDCIVLKVPQEAIDSQHSMWMQMELALLAI